LNAEIFDWTRIPYEVYATIKTDRHTEDVNEPYCSHFLKKGTKVQVTHALVSNKSISAFFQSTQFKVRANSCEDFLDNRSSTSSLFQYVGPEEIELPENKKITANLFFPPSGKEQLPEY